MMAFRKENQPEPRRTPGKSTYRAVMREVSLGTILTKGFWPGTSDDFVGRGGVLIYIGNLYGVI
jgi:hypothetical protein